MFLLVEELDYTDDGNNVCGNSALINTENIIRIETIGTGLYEDCSAKIIMTDGKEIIVGDQSFKGFIDCLDNNNFTYNKLRDGLDALHLFQGNLTDICETISESFTSKIITRLSDISETIDALRLCVLKLADSVDGIGE